MAAAARLSVVVLADRPDAVVDEADDVPCNLAVDDHRLGHDRLVGQDLRPVRSERFAVTGRKRRQLGRDRVELLLEEDRDV